MAEYPHTTPSHRVFPTSPGGHYLLYRVELYMIIPGAMNFWGLPCSKVSTDYFPNYEDGWLFAIRWYMEDHPQVERIVLSVRDGEYTPWRVVKHWVPGASR